MIRIALKDGKMVVDHDGRAPGRGVYICREGDCLDRAFQIRAFQRAIRRQLTEDEKRYLIDEIQKQS